MKINRLKLTSFRSYDYLDVEFKPNINFLVGENGAGKTNVLEAISLLTLGKSFVTSNEYNVITLGSKYAQIDADVEAEKVKSISMILSNEGKKININQKEIKKISEMAKKIITINFSPRDVRIFKDSPVERRKFIDSSLSMLSKTYISYLSMFNKLLKRRNLLLKDDIDMIQLEVIDHQLANISYEISKTRNEFIKRLNLKIKQIYQYFFLLGDEVDLKYITLIPVQDDKDKYVESYLNILKENFEIDKKRKSSTKGIHLDDMVFILKKNNIAKIGSQGQNRIASLILKLSLQEMIKEVIDEEPILLLDDALSELDDNFQNKLIDLLQGKEQVFITGTEVPNYLKKYNKYVVSNHELRRK